MRKVWVSISQTFPIPKVLLHCILPYCGKFMGKPIISHMLKYTIRWKSDGRRALILWEKYEYQFPRLSPYHGFCCILPYCGKFMGKPMHFPYAEVYHRMGIGWEKSTHTMGKVWLSISQTFPVPWDLLHFPVQWEIYGETHAFPIWWSIPYDGNLMGKKHPYYGKSMSISFPDFPHTMGFVAFSGTVGNIWGNPCISHMMTSVNFFLCLKMHSLTKMLFWVKSSGSIFSYLYFFD